MKEELLKGLPKEQIAKLKEPPETKYDEPFSGDWEHIHYQSNESMFVKKSNRLNLKKPSLVR